MPNQIAKYTATDAARLAMTKRGYVVISIISRGSVPAGTEFTDFGGHSLRDCKLVVTLKTKYKDLAEQMKVLEMTCPKEKESHRYFRCKLIEVPVYADDEDV